MADSITDLVRKAAERELREYVHRHANASIESVTMKYGYGVNLAPVRDMLVAQLYEKLLPHVWEKAVQDAAVKLLEKKA